MRSQPGSAKKTKGDGGIRVARVEREVQGLISQFLAGTYKGELPGIVTVSMVRMPADLKTARVFISFFNATPAEEKQGVQLLQRRAVEIQKYINDKLALRFCPRLTFMQDEATEKLIKIDQILRDLEVPKQQTPRASKPDSDPDTTE